MLFGTYHAMRLLSNIYLGSVATSFTISFCAAIFSSPSRRVYVQTWVNYPYLAFSLSSLFVELRWSQPVSRLFSFWHGWLESLVHVPLKLPSSILLLLALLRRQKRSFGLTLTRQTLGWYDLGIQQLNMKWDDMLLRLSRKLSSKFELYLTYIEIE